MTTTAQIDPAVAYLTFLATVSDERLARLATRRAFVEMKQQFIRAAGCVRGSMGPLLQRQVRLATEAADLWRVGEHLYEALPKDAELERHALRHQLDSAFRQDAAPR